MEVRPGYKQTEVGVIPEDWRVSTLSALSAFITKGATPTTYGFKWESSGVLFLRSECVAETGLDLSQSMFISDAAHDSLRRSAVKEGDLLVAITGYVGRVVVFEGTADANINQHIARVRITSPLASSRFVYHYLSLPQARSRFNAITTGQVYPQVSLKQVRDAEIPLPRSRAEQEAIAEALSDTDAHIESLEELLAKKRELKQGATEELLTGKTRLPGFSGEWETKLLGDVFSISAGKSKSEYVVAGGRYWVVDMGSVSTDGRLIVSKATNHSGDFLSVGDLVMPKDDIGGGGIIGKVGYIDADETYVLGDHVYRLTAHLGNPLFLSHVINGHRTNNALRKKVIGSAQLGLGRRSVDEQEVTFPPHDEQTAIGTVLADMDADLAELEAKLAKAREVKQGMMQDLLTGRIRLA
jgi:type I restriction enzyme S subunit